MIAHFCVLQAIIQTLLLDLACDHGRHGEYVPNNYGEQSKSFVRMGIIQIIK